MIHGVIFDMDGTITKPCIDWPTLRKRIGVPLGQTIIDHIASLDPPDDQRAEGILLEVEMDAVNRSELNPGAPQLLEYLREREIKTALVTNNHQKAMQFVLKKHGLRFGTTISRDDGPIKPSADLIRKALTALLLSPSEVLSIGDGQYDLEASKNAGVPFLYVTHDRPSFDHSPAVPSLIEALSWIKFRTEQSGSGVIGLPAD